MDLLAGFLEDLASLIASQIVDPTEATPSLIKYFQVCPTWKTISDFERLWRNLTQNVWNTCFVRHGRRSSSTANVPLSIFGKVVSPLTTIGSFATKDTVATAHITVGFNDGSVELFRLWRLRRTYYTGRNEGLYSSVIIGIILSDDTLVFSTMDDLTKVQNFNDGTWRRARVEENVENDGVMIDLSGNNRWWIGLFIGE
ncbi:hypothetical protein ACS0TY_021076 [Phlomoides rotata]